MLDAAPRVRHAECEPYCAGKHLARALTVRVLVGAAPDNTLGLSEVAEVCNLQADARLRMTNS